MKFARWPAGLATHLLAVLVCAGEAAAQEERRYPLADRGFLVMSVPAGWKEQVRRADAGLPPTIMLQPGSGPAFQVLVTPVWPMKPGIARPTGEEMKANVLKAAEAAKAQAVEKSFAAIELKGPAAQGYYFSATDRAPKPGEFKFLKQGMLAVGELRVSFTVLSNDGQDAAAKSALEMLRSSRHASPEGQKPAALAPPGATGALPKPDGGRLQQLLKSGDYARLDAELMVYQDAYRAGAIRDTEISEAFILLVDRDPGMRAAYDGWVAALPKSYVARLSRGYYLMKMGYLARGTEYVQNTPKARLDEMLALHKAAQEDLELSLKLDARPTLSYHPLIGIARGSGARRASDTYLEAAVALDPNVWGARLSYFGNLRPEWGGSLEQMEAAVGAWSLWLTERQVALLRDELESARWRARLEPIAQMVEAKQYQQAIAEYGKVLEKTPVLRAYAMRGMSYSALGQYDKAIEDFNRVLEMDPSGGCCSNARSNRAHAYLKSGKNDLALQDLLYAAERDDDWAARELARIYAFGRYGFKPDYAVARRWCERTAKQGDGLSMYCLGGIYHAGLGVPKDLPLAAYWFASAGVRGIADAQADIGIMYWDGQGVAQDRERAAQWWRLAAAQGNKRAAAKLRDNGYHWSYFRYVTLAEWLGGK